MRSKNLKEITKGLWNYYKKNKALNLNGNIITAGLVAGLSAAGASELAEEITRNPELLTISGIGANVLTFLPTHFGLHYITNKERYQIENGKIDKDKYWKDIGKIWATGAPSIATFFGIYGVGQDLLMRHGIKPWKASLSSYVTGQIASRTLHTYLAKLFGYFKKE